jgi:hypothetical protein
MTVSARDAERDLEHRRRAEELRASAAEHRARAHELRASVSTDTDTDTDTDSADGDGEAYLHAGIEELLAEVADLRAAALDERTRGDLVRADELEQEAYALSAVGQAEAELHEAFSKAAMARARARQERRLAVVARRAAIARVAGSLADLHGVSAERHEAWAELHERLGLAHQLRGQGLVELAETSAREAEELRNLALRAEERVVQAERQAGTESP